jgi:hypothetical protein
MKNAVSGKLHRVALIRTDVSEERIASVIKVTRIGVLGTMLALTSNRNMLHIVFHRSVLQMLVTANIVPSLPVVTLMI